MWSAFEGHQGLSELRKEREEKELEAKIEADREELGRPISAPQRPSAGPLVAFLPPGAIPGSDAENVRFLGFRGNPRSFATHGTALRPGPRDPHASGGRHAMRRRQRRTVLSTSIDI
jgi:hypothetical protein